MSEPLESLFDHKGRLQCARDQRKNHFGDEGREDRPCQHRSPSIPYRFLSCTLCHPRYPSVELLSSSVDFDKVDLKTSWAE